MIEEPKTEGQKLLCVVYLTAAENRPPTTIEILDTPAAGLHTLVKTANLETKFAGANIDAGVQIGLLHEVILNLLRHCHGQG